MRLDYENQQFRLNSALNLVASSSTAKKRKHNESDTEDDTPHATDSEPVERVANDDEDDADQDEEEYKSPKAKPTAGRKGKGKSSPKKKAGPPAKKPRAEKATTLKLATRKGRKLKEGQDTYDPEQVAKDTKISADNPLFSEQSSTERFLF